MSLTLLRHLQEKSAFDSSPLRHDLGVYHVPFSELGSNEEPEQTLVNAARRAERLMIVGPSGSGKSSLIEHALGPMVERIAPIHVPVAGESGDVVTNVQAVSGMIIQQIVQHANLTNTKQKDVMRWASSQRPLDSKVRTSSVSVGVTWMGIDLRTEIKRQVPNNTVLPNTASGTLEIVDQLLTTIQKKGLMPVLVFDDTDRWFRDINTRDNIHHDFAMGFFGKVLTEIRQLRAGLVVAVHDDYLANNQLKDYIGNVVENRINIPILNSVGALGKVILSRVKVHRPTSDSDRIPSLDEVMTTDALIELYQFYQKEFSGSLRKVVRTMHGALADACNGGFEIITPDLIHQAIW